MQIFDKELRFLIVGGVNTLFGFSIYPLIYIVTRSIELSYIWVLVPSQMLSISFSFITYKYLVYRTKGNHFREYTRFSMFHVVMFALNLVFLPIMVKEFIINPMIAQTLFSCFAVITSYFWYKSFAFKNNI